MARYDWIDAYNFARENPGWASTALLFAWPLFIALAAVAVVLSPLVFPGAMIASYVLKATNAPPMVKPKPKAAASGGGGSSTGSYLEQYPEVAPKANLRECPPPPPSFSQILSPSIAPGHPLGRK